MLRVRASLPSRGSTREKALATLIAYLRDNYRDEDAAAK
jgi:hypothetical protein